jgi:hypothetical protein
MPGKTRGIDAASPLFPVIHAGDVVRIRRQDAMLHINLTGIAEENGAIGKPIRVHLLHQLTNGFNGAPTGFSGNSRPLMAVIRGPHEVEIEQ